eukprot:COSAG01_NODE_963_length_12407_cov_38.330598_14_plen_172_part_00
MGALVCYNMATFMPGQGCAAHQVFVQRAHAARKHHSRSLLPPPHHPSKLATHPTGLWCLVCVAGAECLDFQRPRPLQGAHGPVVQCDRLIWRAVRDARGEARWVGNLLLRPGPCDWDSAVPRGLEPKIRQRRWGRLWLHSLAYALAHRRLHIRLRRPARPRPHRADRRELR